MWIIYENTWWVLVTFFLGLRAQKISGHIMVTMYITMCQGLEVELGDRGRTVILDAPLDTIPLHVRGGYILPSQEPANTTKFR